jgi:hypothetical protein
MLLRKIESAPTPENRAKSLRTHTLASRELLGVTREQLDNQEGLAGSPLDQLNQPMR